MWHLVLCSRCLYERNHSKVVWPSDPLFLLMLVFLVVKLIIEDWVVSLATCFKIIWLYVINLGSYLYGVHNHFAWFTLHWNWDLQLYFLRSCQQVLIFFLQIAFQVLVKVLINLDPGEEMELLKKIFQEFISGLMFLPINFPGTKLYQSL